MAHLSPAKETTCKHEVEIEKFWQEKNYIYIYIYKKPLNTRVRAIWTRGRNFVSHWKSLEQLKTYTRQWARPSIVQIFHLDLFVINKWRWVQAGYFKPLPCSEVFKVTFLFGHIINIFLTELGRSVWENLNLGGWYRPHCVRSVLATSVKIIS